MAKLSILVVEDEALERANIAELLSDHNVDFAEDEAAGRKHLASSRPDICFLDLKLGKGDDCSGLKLIPLAVAKGSYTVVMSGHDSPARVKQAYKLGCHDFFAKGAKLKKNVELVLGRYHARQKQDTAEQVFDDGYVTVDPETRASIAEALKYAVSDLPILLLGPSGTGKTRLARIVHEHSGRKGQFVAINCAAFSQDLLEAELFGYKKGAFTDAKEDRPGKLLQADQGTLFLDEFGAMSLKMQTKLLKAIEERAFYPLGSAKPETSQFRIISATLEDLTSLVEARKLRVDFLQRIHGLSVRLKPLCERTCDIFPLIDRLTSGGRRLSFNAEAQEQLLRHEWSGNIRQLKMLVDLLAAGTEGEITGDKVAQMLANLSAETGGFVTPHQYRYAREHGIKATLRRITDELIKRNLADNAGNKRRVLADLKTNTRALYGSLARSAEKEASNSGR